MSSFDMDDGVFVDLTFDEYLAIDAISSSQLKAASVSVEKWEYQQLHQFNSTPSMVVGSALDCLLTEGHAQYVKQYDDGSQPSDVEYLATVAEIKAALKERDLKLTGGKPELAERLFSDGWQGIIKGVNDGGDGERVKLTKSQVGTVEKCSEAIHRAGLVSECFRGGYGQISIVWTSDGGDRFKARFDYLKNGAIYDLKTTSGKPDKSIMECVVSDVINYRYDIQAVQYVSALEAAKHLPIVWCGSRGDDNDLRHHLKPCGVFEFVFQRTVAPYDNATALFSPVVVGSDEQSRAWGKACLDMQVAHERIVATKEAQIFGIKKGPVRAELTDDLIPGWFLNS